MDINLNIKKFEDEVSKIKRPGIDKLLAYIRSSDMYSAPSSTMFHLSTKGGLLQHSLNVLYVLRSLLKNNENGTYTYLICGKEIDEKFTISEESLIIIALFHDLCKTKFYKEEIGWRKDEKNKWEQFTKFSVDDQVPLGHGEKSAMMIQQFMTLKPVELYAIRWHMGFSENSNNNTIGKAIELYPIIWAVHCADMMAANFIEAKTDNIDCFKGI